MEKRVGWKNVQVNLFFFLGGGGGGLLKNGVMCDILNVLMVKKGIRKKFPPVRCNTHY